MTTLNWAGLALLIFFVDWSFMLVVPGIIAAGLYLARGKKWNKGSIGIWIVFAALALSPLLTEPFCGLQSASKEQSFLSRSTFSEWADTGSWFQSNSRTLIVKKIGRAHV